MHAAATTLPPTLPIVVHLGFAGSRRLYDEQPIDAAQSAVFDQQLVVALGDRLRELPARLGLTQHLLCGISGVAVGADTVFSHALQALQWPQRVLLPQRADDYLRAGRGEQADFSPAEQAVARALLAAPHVIERRVASDAEDRSERFEDTNLAIAHASDLVVCLFRAGARARSGGTHDLMQQAARAGKPVWTLEVTLRDGQPVLSPWIPAPGPAFAPPGMPAELRGLAMTRPERGWPPAPDYIETVRRFASAKTRQHSGLFKRAAFTIIALHIGATLLAVLAGKAALTWEVAALLAAELVLLALGLRTHHALHRSAAARAWAVTRLLAEALRSMASVSATSASLDYTDHLALPESFRPLLRTAAVLHGLQTRRAASNDWAAQRERYLEERLTGEHGQLGYFAHAASVAAQRLALAHSGFWVFSVGAFAATTAKLVAVSGLLPGALTPPLIGWGGMLAITLPVAAVGFLSWAAASDLEARAATYADMHAFLSRQVQSLREAGTARDFERAVRDTELGILGENLGWFSRRLFKGVS
jgi:hypothetical protein